MSRQLSWRVADRGDRAVIESFRCTPDPGRLPNGRRTAHPRPWEVEVQVGIHKTKAKFDDAECMLLGEDSDGIAAIGYYVELEPDYYKILAVALALRVRNTLSGHAEETMDVIFHHIMERADARGVQDVQVVGWVHRSNTASRRMCGETGMLFIRPVSEDLDEFGTILSAG